MESQPRSSYRRQDWCVVIIWVMLPLSSILSASRCLPHIPRRIQPCVYLSNASVLSLSLLPDTDIFFSIFADLLCTDPLSARVWFECAWVALFWLMHLGAFLRAVQDNTSHSYFSWCGRCDRNCTTYSMLRPRFN